jgi:SAM-dependent methyltransferase
MSTNRLLTNEDRVLFQPIIDKMFDVIPEQMSKKISEANVQQAFGIVSVLESMERNTPLNVFGVGIYEDTCYDFLMKVIIEGSVHNLFGIDPNLPNNFDLHTFKDTIQPNCKFDTIFSISVLEHVQDDEEFIRDICYLLHPGGTAILTCDFNNSYKNGDPVPATVVRQYTKYDLETRLNKIIQENGCSLVDVPNWDGEPDFIYQGYKYSFATLVFRKDSNV